MAETFDLHISDDGRIYRHFSPEHPTCSPVFDPHGVDIEQNEAEMMAIFETMKSENERLQRLIAIASNLQITNDRQQEELSEYLEDLRACGVSDLPDD